MEKAKKYCSNCDTKYIIKWDLEEQDLDPLNCPFCGHEVEIEEELEQEEDSWD